MWSMISDRGRQVWQYVHDFGAGKSSVGSDNAITNDTHIKPIAGSRNPNSGDTIFRDQMLKRNYKEYDGVRLDETAPLAARVRDSYARGINYFQALQQDDGHWAGDYGGPMFLLPGFIITYYITGTPLGVDKERELSRYLFNHQHPDGGWGLHIEEKSTMFGTVLSYISLRIMGVPETDARLTKARALIHQRGGAQSIPSWGKFWLAVLGVYDWRGTNSLFPDMWMLPTWLPVHAARYWCHCRMVYLPMSYLYGVRFVAKMTPLISSLRNEIYTKPYSEHKWESYRNLVCPHDLYTPHSKMMKVFNFFLNVYERRPIRAVRDRALKFILEYIRAEDEQTKFVDIGPVNKAINMLAIWTAEGNSVNFKSHVDRAEDYFWQAEDGMKVQGYNGSQLWDTAFTVQAILETKNGVQFAPALRSAYSYLDISQVLEDVKDREKYFRHISKGGWPFSTRDHGWPISDCTAEGLKAALILHESGLIEGKSRVITDDRLADAVNVILSFQNKDGGWATYEQTRGPAWLELINASEVFGDIMIDYSYVECTSACVTALVKYQHVYPGHRTKAITKSIANGVKFIKNKQRADGSWYGSWAVCFTYGTWFGIDGLIEAGESPSSPAIRRACQFLLSKQMSDGGWGESFQSCVTKQYVQHEHSQVINTAWAVMSLLRAQCPDRDAITRGIQLLLRRQQDNGDWLQEGISGVFNGNCMITYSQYRNIFPIWALARYQNMVTNEAAASSSSSSSAAVKETK